MSTLKFHKNGEVSIRISKQLAQRIALAMPQVKEEAVKHDEFLSTLETVEPVNLRNQASELWNDLALSKNLWRTK